ncbi:unnamed protein product [Rodentolepis nana]|uniref:Zf-RVT domain-containing protein n=1 Tax=Rodentolepis nana TaxID=102285 RepID=A0A0R3TEB1_RODNA|nr:unnamed protein product [Rodentolepis nana]
MSIELPRRRLPMAARMWGLVVDKKPEVIRQPGAEDRWKVLRCQVASQPTNKLMGKEIVVAVNADVTHSNSENWAFKNLLL